MLVSLSSQALQGQEVLIAVLIAVRFTSDVVQIQCGSSTHAAHA
jgi:hypothetical protein